MSKKQLGQFFTRNSEYILNGLEGFVEGKIVSDPFAGDGDLLLWANDCKAKKVIGYDVDDRYINKKTILYNDSIKNPLEYKFILTNPPYLNINKADKKTKSKYFEGSGLDDLYQISLRSIMDSEEGIIIVPINFLSAENSRRIRDIFFDKFEIVKMNYFKHRVFPDTTYNVISFYYKLKANRLNNKFVIETNIYPDGETINFELKKDFHWTIGGGFLEAIKDQKNNLGVYRLTERDIKNNKGGMEVMSAYNHVKNKGITTVSGNLYDLLKSNIILLRAIDSGTEKGKIALDDIRQHKIDCLISKESSRHMVYLIFKAKIPVSQQKELIDIFNQQINEMRYKYSSLFLTNYRDNGRKRISFDFVYKFINYIYFHKIHKNIGQRSLLFKT